MDDSVCEVVLIGVDQTALQAMYDHPAGAKKGVLLLHPKGSSRHDRTLRRLQTRMAEGGLAVLLPDLVDEDEGWHNFGSAEFFLHRAEAVLQWWLQRQPELSVVAIAPGYDAPLAQQLLTHPQLEAVVLEADGGFWRIDRHTKTPLERLTPEALWP